MTKKIRFIVSGQIFPSVKTDFCLQILEGWRARSNTLFLLCLTTVQRHTVVVSRVLKFFRVSKVQQFRVSRMLVISEKNPTSRSRDARHACRCDDASIEFNSASCLASNVELILIEAAKSKYTISTWPISNSRSPGSQSFLPEIERCEPIRTSDLAISSR